MTVQIDYTKRSQIKIYIGEGFVKRERRLVESHLNKKRQSTETPADRTKCCRRSKMIRVTFFYKY